MNGRQKIFLRANIVILSLGNFIKHLLPAGPFFELRSHDNKSLGYCCRNSINRDQSFNTLRPRQDGRHFPDTFSNAFSWIKMLKFPLTFTAVFSPKGPINNIPALVQIMAWRRPGDKPLSEPVMASLLTHICVTRPQWVNHKGPVMPF